MSCRPNFPPFERREKDVRKNRNPLTVKKNTFHKTKAAPRKFFSKSLICKRRPFIRLFCPHCHTRCLKFDDYKKHLHSDKHIRAINRRIQRIESEVDLRRKEQQTAQEAADKAAQLLGNSSNVVKYCEVCDLNFYQEESKHIASKLHILLRKLLQPVCNICCYEAKDAVDYENHICSLDHLKQEEGWTGELESRQQSHPEHSQQCSEEASTSSEASAPTLDNRELSDPNQPSGEEVETVISKVEALYCSCCKVYFSCEDGHDVAKAKHCATPQHMALWVESVEDKYKSEEMAKQAAQEDLK